MLDTTPFYAEGGGQRGDRGTLTAVSLGGQQNGSEPAVLEVADVQKAAGGSLFVHSATLTSGALSVGEKVCSSLGSLVLLVRFELAIHETHKNTLEA